MNSGNVPQLFDTVFCHLSVLFVSYLFSRFSGGVFQPWKVSLGGLDVIEYGLFEIIGVYGRVPTAWGLQIQILYITLS